MSFPLPPDTRAVGTGDPPADMNKVVDALAAMGALNYVGPSGDSSGATDLSVIQGRINAATGPVWLTPGTYFVNGPLTLVNGSELIGFHDGGFGGTWSQVAELQLVNASNSSMIVAGATANYWKLKNLFLNANGIGQTGPAQTGSTGACIHVADTGSPAELQAEMDSVYVQSPYNDALYLGSGRRSLRARWCKFMASGTGNATYGAGNGVTCNYSDHVFYACSVGGNNHHGFNLSPANASAIRITDCDIFTNGADWAAITPTTVAAGSNGQTVSGLTGVGVLNVASTTGFPATGSLLINVSTGQVAVTYTGTSGGNQFTGVAVQATQGNGGGTLATGQGVYILGGDAVHVGSAAAGVSLLGNSMDRNNGSGVFVESSVNSVKIVGNRFLSNSQAATGLLPHINIVNANLQTTIAGNGMEPVVSGFTAQCSNFITVNVAGSGWVDGGNSWLFAQLSTGSYTNSPNSINPFSAGSFWVQGTNTGRVTALIKKLAAQTADLTQWQDNSANPIARVNATGQIGSAGLLVAEGSNAKQGTAALTAGSAVVANTSVTATSRIFLTSNADGGTPGWLRVSARSAGTSFTITSSSGADTSTVAYEIFEVGP